MPIKSKIRTVPDYPVKGIQFRDISTLISDPEGLQLVVKDLKERYETKNEFDIIVGIEARGFIVGSALAYSLKKGFIMIRKPGKLPGEVISQEYELEYGSDKMEIQSDAFLPGTRVLVVDDLIATGGTVISAIALVEKLGGIVTETAFIVDLPDLGGSQKLKQNGYNIFSLTEFEGD
ncbi:MAG: adenine phosphoribosyltransferase [Gammaproteobacteria bacterium]|mgnify:CR=1 FL=1|nr:adenine phosphoribosyltransferase [Gammaproteobacteria bacterium]|tara:strand:- start:7102 stop:7632 length:531 start_codon:yes stop_codon:yes gene_type:complete